MKILGNVAEGLLGADAGGAIEPRLAESYRVSGGGRRLEFRLRPGAAWSDGVPVTAEDFVTAFRRAMSPATASKFAEFLEPVREVTGGDGMVTVELKRSVTYFLKVLALPFAAPERAGVLGSNGGRWPELGPVTGPYRIVEHRPGERIVLEPNPNSWRKPSPDAPAKVVFQVIEDESTAVSLFGQGKLDILTRIPSLDLPRLSAEGVVRRDPFLATYYLSFNCRVPPFDRAEWRRAVSGAIRRAEITEAVASGETPARGWIPPRLEGHIPYTDPSAAFAPSLRRVKKEIGRSPRGEIPAAFDSSERNRVVMEKVQGDLARSLGLRIRLEPADWKTHVARISVDPPPIYRFGWLAPFLDPLSHLQVFVTGNANNHSGWSNAEYDRLVARIAELRPGPERARSIVRAQEILVDREAAVVPIYHYVQNHAVGPRVDGFRADPFGVIPLTELRVGR